MKLPKYPLQVVFDQRLRAQDAAQQLVGERLAELARAEASLAAACAAREAAAAALSNARNRLYDPDPDGRLDVQVVAERKAGLQFRERELSELAAAERAATATRDREVAALATAREALAEAARECMAIEKHRETWLLEVRLEMGRKEEAEIAEVANAGWLRSREESER